MYTVQSLLEDYVITFLFLPYVDFIFCGGYAGGYYLLWVLEEDGQEENFLWLAKSW